MTAGMFEKLHEDVVEDILEDISLFEVLRRVTKERLQLVYDKEKVRMHELYADIPTTYLFRHNARERYAFEVWSDFESAVICKVWFADSDDDCPEYTSVGYSKVNHRYDRFNLDVGVKIAIRRALTSLLGEYCYMQNEKILLDECQTC